MFLCDIFLFNLGPGGSSSADCPVHGRRPAHSGELISQPVDTSTLRHFDWSCFSSLACIELVNEASVFEYW